jgi:hypothetical protein
VSLKGQLLPFPLSHPPQKHWETSRRLPPRPRSLTCTVPATPTRLFYSSISNMASTPADQPEWSAVKVRDTFIE